MQLINLLFYFTFAFLVLIIFIGTVRGFDKKTIQTESIYWPLALGLMVLSSFAFGMNAWYRPYFVTIANTTMVFSGVATALLIRSWAIPSATSLLKALFLAGIVFACAFESLRLLGKYEWMVYLVLSSVALTTVWALFEINTLSKEESSFHLIVLKYALVIGLCLSMGRAYFVYLEGSNTSSIYEENIPVTILRLLSMSSYLLIYIAIGNIFYRHVLKEEKQKTYDLEQKMLASLNALAQARDDETGNHINRTQQYVRIIAERLRAMGLHTEQLTDQFINHLYRAAPLHDIGKVGIPDQILYKNGSLTKDEWTVMKTHTTIGNQVLSAARDQISKNDIEDVISIAIQIATSHHEQWNGSGYPAGLKGDAIPLSARIMALADMYDALLSERVYKREWTHEEAIAEILDKKGRHFDPAVVEAFFVEHEHFKDIAQRFKDHHSNAKPHTTKVNNVAEQKLNRSEEKFRYLFEHSPIGIAMVDHATGEFLEVNATFCKYTGYSSEELCKLRFWDITPPEYTEQEHAQHEAMRLTGEFGPNEKEYIHKDGHRFPIEIRGFLLNDVDGRQVVWGVIEDLSESKKLEAQIQQLAYYDPLTKLPNRHLLEDRMHISMASSKRSGRYGALLFIDLDGLKEINDQHGHQIGDDLLLKCGERLKATIRGVDTVARFGGDEFVIVLNDLDQDINHAIELSRNISQKILQSLEAPYFIDQQDENNHIMQFEYRSSASIGITLFSGDDVSMEKIFEHADLAMYQAKRAGGNQIHLHTVSKNSQETLA